MKVGDLVKYNALQTRAIPEKLTGLVIEIGIYVGRKDVKILWNHEGQTYSCTEKSRELEVISGRS